MFKILVLHIQIQEWEAYDWDFHHLSFAVMRCPHSVAEELVGRQVAEFSFLFLFPRSSSSYYGHDALALTISIVLINEVKV